MRQQTRHLGHCPQVNYEVLNRMSFVGPHLPSGDGRRYARAHTPVQQGALAPRVRGGSIGPCQLSHDVSSRGVAVLPGYVICSRVCVGARNSVVFPSPMSGSLAHPRSPIPHLLTLTSRATHAHPALPRSTGFCAIWGCISSSALESQVLERRVGFLFADCRVCWNLLRPEAAF